MGLWQQNITQVGMSQRAGQSVHHCFRWMKTAPWQWNWLACRLCWRKRGCYPPWKPSQHGSAWTAGCKRVYGAGTSRGTHYNSRSSWPLPTTLSCLSHQESTSTNNQLQYLPCNTRYLVSLTKAFNRTRPESIFVPLLCRKPSERSPQFQ